FLLISLEPEEAYRRGINVRLWDFLFYLSFALVITRSVQVAGVLLVFCYLIAPAVFAVMFADRVRTRIVISWVVGILRSGVGLLLSYNRPSGPTIIGIFALFLMLGAIVRYVMTAPHRGRALVTASGYSAGVVLLAVLGLRFSHAQAHDHETDHPHGEPEH